MCFDYLNRSVGPHIGHDLAGREMEIYQDAPRLIRVKTGLDSLRSRFDWFTFVKYFHGFAWVGFGQVSS